MGTISGQLPELWWARALKAWSPEGVGKKETRQGCWNNPVRPSFKAHRVILLSHQKALQTQHNFLESKRFKVHSTQRIFKEVRGTPILALLQDPRQVSFLLHARCMLSFLMCTHLYLHLSKAVSVEVRRGHVTRGSQSVHC